MQLLEARRAEGGAVSKHTPGPWHFVPWHIEEGQPAVRCAEGWIVATTSNDANAEFIARAPAMEARIAEIEAENERLRQLHVDMKTKLAQYMAWYAMAEHQHLQEEARAERAEANAANWEEQANDRVSDWDEVRAERDALRADAERYRVARAKVCIVGDAFHVINLRPTYVAPDAAIEFDAAIDAARGG